jgi:16S rRNA G966 N2-methylase RsmD
VLDAVAGTGTLGPEALSRGAAEAVLARQAASHSEDIAAVYTDVAQRMIVELQQRALNRVGFGASPTPESTIETAQRVAPE